MQYNDPDPVQWMAIYGAAALACILALVRRLWRWYAVGVALVAAVWAATLAPVVIGHVALRDLFGKAGMLTRSALGAYQKANGLKLDCWPTAAVLEHMQRAAR